MSISLLSKRSQAIFHERPQIVYHILFACIWFFSLVTGAMGVDFRSHWDEHKLFKSIRETIPLGEVLPGWYNYPSMIYDLTVLSAAPEILTAYFADRSAFREVMERKLRSDELTTFKLRARTLFLAITTLSLLWTYLLVHAWTRRWSQALAGSAILASSWELAYHARWIAPDAILMQFGILTILLVFLSLHAAGRRRFFWLGAAAVAAGLACGTKYFGGIFLVPVVIGGYKLLKDTSAKGRDYVVLLLALGIVFSITFLLITPGALFDTARMIQDIRYEMGHYQAGDEGYTVRSGWQHLSLLLVYLFGVFFSRYVWISLLFSVLALIGLYSLLKENWKATETWVFLSVPILFIPYMSQQTVMMVRNDLLLFPFLAILSSRGIAAIWNLNFLQASRTARTAFVVGVASVLFVNFGWLYSAADTISAKLTVDWTQKLDNYLLENKETTYYLSPGVRSAMDTTGFPNVVNDPLQADKLIFVFSEVNHALANRPNVYDPIFGPYEVNFDYYPSWNEDERILVMPMKAALPQAQFGFIYE